MTKTHADTLNARLDQLDAWLADPEIGIALYQILSGSVRGPDDGQGKSATTMNLRRICFPQTCRHGNTGMMSNSLPSEGLPTPTWSGLTVSHHFKGHVQQAVNYLQACGRWPHAKAVAAKEK